MKISKKHINGFTLIELSVVAVIIAILATLGTISYKGIMNNAVSATLKADYNSAANIFKQYYNKYGDYPYSLDANYCPLDSTGTDDMDYCLTPSTDNTYTSYTVNNTAQPPTYSITAVNANGMTYSGGKSAVTRSGKLTVLSAYDPGTADAEYMDISTDGKFVYSIDYSLDLLTIASRNLITGALTNISSSTLNTGDGPASIAVSPDNLSVYVANYIGGTLSTYSRNLTTGELMPLGTPNGVTDARDIVISPDGKFVYIAESWNYTISVFSRNLSTGALTRLAPSSQFGTSGDSFVMCMSPDGTSLYAVSDTDRVLDMFSRNTTTGLLTAIGTPINIVEAETYSAQVSPDGKNLYTLAYSGTIKTFTRNTSTGLLTEVSSIDPGILNGQGLAISKDGNTVYIIDSRNEDTLVWVYGRNSTTGLLSLLETKESYGDGWWAILVSPDDNFVYLGGDVVTAYRR